MWSRGKTNLFLQFVFVLFTRHDGGDRVVLELPAFPKSLGALPQLSRNSGGSPGGFASPDLLSDGGDVCTGPTGAGLCVFLRDGLMGRLLVITNV